jgi:hypothetical protein
MPDIREAHVSLHAFQEKGKLLHPVVDTHVTRVELQGLCDQESSISCTHEMSVKHAVCNDLLWISHPAEEAEASF